MLVDFLSATAPDLHQKHPSARLEILSHSFITVIEFILVPGTVEALGI